MTMQIKTSSTHSSQNFKGRRADIKDAQDICRAVRNNFPYISYSKAACEASNKILKKEDIYNYIIKMNNTLKSYREDRQFIRTPFNFYKEVIYSTVKAKVAACYDLAVLAEMIMKMNGVKNCGKTGLITSNGDRINHCVAYVQLGKKFDAEKIIIIDPWLQEVDFLKNMHTKYNNQYRKYLTRKGVKDEIVFDFKKQWNLQEKEIEQLREKYPQLIFKKALFNAKK